jgi:hypothetical protein
VDEPLDHGRPRMRDEFRVAPHSTERLVERLGFQQVRPDQLRAGVDEVAAELAGRARQEKRGQSPS